MRTDNGAYRNNPKRIYWCWLFASLFLLQLLGTLSLFAQPMERVNPYRLPEDRIHTKEYLYYFDQEEIRQRGFREAYIIRHPSCWAMHDPAGFQMDESCALADTVTIICFDAQGRISSRVDYQTSGFSDHKTWKSRFFSKSYRSFDTLGRPIQPFLTVRYDDGKLSSSLVDERRFAASYNDPQNPGSFKSYRVGADSVSHLIAFAKNGNTFDTTFTIRQVYNNHGFLLEDVGTASEWFLKENRRYEDASDRDFRYLNRYQYDSLDRLVYEYSDYNSFYTIYTYTSWGKTWEHRNKHTNSIGETGAEIWTYNYERDRLQISDGWSLTAINYMEAGSKLVTLITRSITRETPSIEYTEVVYK